MPLRILEYTSLRIGPPTGSTLETGYRGDTLVAEFRRSGRVGQL